METLSNLAGILGLVAIIFSSFLTWRKKLLTSSFTLFQERYRIEMDDFKMTIRDMVKSNDDKHSVTLDKILQLNTQTHNEVTSQTNICRVIQARREGTKEADDLWRENIENELKEIREDVRHIKKLSTI